MHLVYNKVFLLISGEATQEKKKKERKRCGFTWGRKIFKFDACKDSSAQFSLIFMSEGFGRVNFRERQM